MTKQTQRFIKGTLILSIAGMLAKVISVFYKVPLEYLTGTVGLGLYQAVYPLYSVLTAAALIGIPNSISKIIAEDIAKREYRKAHLTFRTGLFLTTGIGLFISLFLLIFGKEIVRVFPWDKGTYYVLIGLSISPAFVGVSGAIRGYMQGMQEMVPTAVSQIIENTMKVLIGIGLVIIFIKMDASLPITVGGAAFGASAGFIIASLYLLYEYIRKQPKIRERIESDSHGRSYDRKRILMKIGHIAIPVTIASATFSIMSLIDSLTISNFIRGSIEVEGKIVEEASYILGLIAKAQTVINVPLVLSVSLIINIVPSVSAANVQKDKNELKLKIWEGIDMAIKLALPAAVGIIVLAEPILTLLYREGEGAYYLQLYGISLVLMILAQSLTGMLQGLSKYYVPLWIVFIAAIAKLLFNITLLEPLHGQAAMFSTIVYYLVISIASYCMLRKYVDFKVQLFQTYGKPLLASALMGGITFFSYRILYGIYPSNTISTLVSVGIGMVVYLVTMLLMKAFNEDELMIMPLHDKLIKWSHIKKAGKNGK